MEQTHVLVAVKQFIISEGLVSAVKNLKIAKTIRKANSCDELDAALKNGAATFIIVDSHFAECPAIDKIIELKRQNQELKILVVTDGLEVDEIAEFNSAGLHNILLINSDEEDFVSAIDNTLKGKMFYSNDILEKLLHNKNTATPKVNVNLTPSELEIVKLIAAGYTTKLIADKKNISFHTVVTHRKNIFKKMGINSSSELIMQAIKLNLIDNIEYYI